MKMPKTGEKDSSDLLTLKAFTVGTFAQYTLLHPLWSAKVSAQTPSKPPLKLTIKNIPTLYRGYPLSIIYALPISSIHIYTGNKVKRLFPKLDGNAQLFFSGAIYGTVSTPISTITDCVMIQQKFYGDKFYTCFKDIIKERGIKGLFAGSILTLLKNTSRYTSYFAVFPIIREYVSLMAEQYSKSGFATKFFSSTVAALSGGIFTTIFTNPVNVIKTTQQSNLLRGKRYSVSMRAAIYEVYSSRGMPGFFRGIGYSLASKTIGVFIMGMALQQRPDYITSSSNKRQMHKLV